MKTLLLFDIDGTLLFSNKADSRCFANSYEAVFGRRFPTIDWTKFPEVTDHVIFRTAFQDHFGYYPSEAERLTFEEYYLAALTQVRGRIGMSNDFPAVYPFSAPAASPLSTQVGRLNFNDGAGYLTASAEYILTDTNDTVRVDVRGDRLFELDFGQPVPPLRGVNLTVEIAANYKDIFGAANLTADEASVADAILAGLENWLVITGIR